MLTFIVYYVNMSTEQEVVGYQKQALILSAKEQDFDITARMIDDWVSIGLLDRPNKRGLGRGKGMLATWPDNQRQLLLTLLLKRKEIKKLITPLFNIPVWIWLEYGEEHVPLRQMKRALLNWSLSHGYRANSWKRARLSARALLDSFKHEGSTRADRNTLVEILARASYSGTCDLLELRPAVKKVFDPDGVERELGPRGAQLTVDSIVSLVDARLKTIARIENISDDEFNSARIAYAQATNLYWRDLPRFVSNPDMGDFFKINNVEERLNSACMSLITLIGLQDKANSNPKGGEKNASRID